MGERVAEFEQIYRDYFREVFFYVRRLSGGDERLAEDVTSEAFFRALRRALHAFSAILHAIAGAAFTRGAL